MVFWTQNTSRHVSVLETNNRLISVRNMMGAAGVTANKENLKWEQIMDFYPRDGL